MDKNKTKINEIASSLEDIVALSGTFQEILSQLMDDYDIDPGVYEAFNSLGVGIDAQVEKIKRLTDDPENDEIFSLFDEQIDEIAMNVDLMKEQFEQIVEVASKYLNKLSSNNNLNEDIGLDDDRMMQWLDKASEVISDASEKIDFILDSDYEQEENDYYDEINEIKSNKNFKKMKKNLRKEEDILSLLNEQEDVILEIGDNWGSDYGRNWSGEDEDYYYLSRYETDYGDEEEEGNDYTLDQFDDVEGSKYAKRDYENDEDLFFEEDEDKALMETLIKMKKIINY
jgi:hypothetical protein